MLHLVGNDGEAYSIKNHGGGGGGDADNRGLGNDDGGNAERSTKRNLKMVTMEIGEKNPNGEKEGENRRMVAGDGGMGGGDEEMVDGGGEMEGGDGGIKGGDRGIKGGDRGMVEGGEFNFKDTESWQNYYQKLKCIGQC